VNHGSTSNNESFNNVLHMFISKRIVYKSYGPMYGRLAKIMWNEEKCTRKVSGATWKAARTGARKNAVVPKAFQAKRKGDRTWHFAAEAIGRLKRRVFDPSHRFSSGWLELEPPSADAAAAPVPAPRKTWGKAKAMGAAAARQEAAAATGDQANGL